MFDAPVDAWYVWLGVGAVSLAAFGVAAGLPTAAPPDATAAADAVDAVATSPPGSTTTHDLDATQLRVDRGRIGLRGPGGSAHAAVAFGPVTPADTDDRLESVLDGRVPSAVFDGPDAMTAAAETAREDGTEWRRAPDELTVRRVAWEGIDVLLVG